MGERGFLKQGGGVEEEIYPPPRGEGNFYSESLKNASIYRQKCFLKHKTGKIFSAPRPPVPNMTLYSMGEGVNSHSGRGGRKIKLRTLPAHIRSFLRTKRKYPPPLGNFSEPPLLLITSCNLLDPLSIRYKIYPTLEKICLSLK